MNFGLAAEQAKSEGYKVEVSLQNLKVIAFSQLRAFQKKMTGSPLQTVIVGEDCALPPPRGIAGRRGLAGTVLIHKVLSTFSFITLNAVHSSVFSVHLLSHFCYYIFSNCNV